MKKLIPILMLIPLGCSSCGFRHNLKEAINQYDREREPQLVMVCDTVAALPDNSLINEGRYERLFIDGAIAVCMSPDCQEARVEADAKDLNRVSLLIEGNKLKIDYKGRRTGTCRPIRVVLPQRGMLTDVELDGASYFEGALCGNANTISADEASKAVVDLGRDVYRVKVECDGASKVIVRGSSVLVEAEVDGASHADLSGLQVQRARMEMDGASCATVNASVSIDGEMEDASHLRYIGNPELLVQVGPSCRVEKIEN